MSVAVVKNKTKQKQNQTERKRKTSSTKTTTTNKHTKILPKFHSFPTFLFFLISFTFLSFQLSISLDFSNNSNKSDNNKLLVTIDRLASLD